MPSDDDDDDDRPPGFPAGVRLAGVMWIAVGILQLLLTALMTLTLLPGNGRGVGGVNSVVLCVIFAGSGVGAALLFAGYRTVTGRAGGTLGYSVGSLVLGALYFALAVLAAVAAVRTDRNAQFGGLAVAMSLVVSVVSGLFTLLYVPGLLGLAGRQRYRVWREDYRPDGW